MGCEEKTETNKTGGTLLPWLNGASSGIIIPFFNIIIIVIILKV